MHLAELVKSRPFRAPSSVPDWMLGAFVRANITYFDGRSDKQTQVYWLQSRNFTIDLRLPRAADLVRAAPLQQYTESELRVLANYEGFVADSIYERSLLRWEGGVALQLHNRWSEAAELRRVGDCLIEFAPSGAYVEDWRVLTKKPGPLVGLRLIEERSERGELLARDGGLILCDDWAGLVRGRPLEIDCDSSPNQLRRLVAAARGNEVALAHLLSFETSIGRGDWQAGYVVTHSTGPQRMDAPLLPLDGFDPIDGSRLIQRVTTENGCVEREWLIDTLEESFDFSATSPTTREGEAWFIQESETLGRYFE